LTGRRFGSLPSYDGHQVVLDDDLRLRGHNTVEQNVPSTVWIIEHRLGFDPAGILVVDADGFQLDGFGVQYLVPGQLLRLSFDISVAGVAYLS
jgi:hypothetical protein